MYKPWAHLKYGAFHDITNNDHLRKPATREIAYGSGQDQQSSTPQLTPLFSRPLRIYNNLVTV